jgi:Zn-finger nucleic acid-binding protein
MTCPKCSGEMRSYERNGIHVDQCSDCRGLFLDRGELEHLVEAESSFYGGAREPERDDSFEYKGRHHKKRKRNFLEELFD